MKSIADRAEQLLGRAVVATTPVAGGDICTTTRLRLSDGRSALAKTHPHPPVGFFETEAQGLGRLRSVGAVRVAEVLAVAGDCLVLGWVEPERPTVESAAQFGHDLTRLHAADCSGFGAEKDGFIGTLPLPNRGAPTWPEFYATRRVLPYLKLASDRGHIERDDVATIDAVLHRLGEVAGPEAAASLLHGDLWSGNVLWSSGGAVLIDPAAHGGHRETDLAMLSLFGCPHLERVQAAYQEEAPLEEGWRERQGLHQLFPLLVHAALFGGQYGHRAARGVRDLLS